MYIYHGKISWSNKLQNEGVGIIFPTAPRAGEHAVVLTQWSIVPDGRTDKIFAQAGTIAGNSDSTSLTIHVDTLDLGVILNDHDNQLLLTVRNGPNNESPSTLSLIYRSDVPPSAQRIYAGIFNWGNTEPVGTHRATDETVFVIASEDVHGEAPLCILWQWSEVDGAGEKVAVNCTDRIRTASSGLAGLTHDGFHLTFKKSVDAQSGTLLAEKMNVDAVVELSELRVFSLSSSSYVKVENDFSDEIVFCTLRDSGAATLDNILAWVSGGLAIASLGSLGLPAAAGTVLTWSGLIPASLGFHSAVLRSKKEADGTLFPRDVMMRKGHSALEIVRAIVRINPGGKKVLVVRLGYVDVITAPSTVKLSTVSQYRDILEFELPNATSTVILSGTLIFTSFKPIAAGTEVSGELETNGGIFTTSADDKVFYHGQPQLPTGNPPDLFQSEASSSVRFTFDLGNSTQIPYVIYRLPTARLWLLRLSNHTVTADDSDKVQIATRVPRDSQIITKIDDAVVRRRVYFSHTNDTLWAIDLNASQPWKIGPTQSPFSVYLVAEPGGMVYRRVKA